MTMSTKKHLNTIMEKIQPRGIRNNNPLNIRRSKSQWTGLVVNPTDKAYCQFKNMYYGWRAAFKLLIDNYYYRHRKRTIRQIICRWAPPEDNNDTDKYAAAVGKFAGTDPDKELPDPHADTGLWLEIAYAMFKVENGVIPDQNVQAYAAWAICDVLNHTMSNPK